MDCKEEDHRLPTTQGKYLGILVCWLLGNGCLFGFNCMLTMEDCFVYIFPKFHPTRVITLAYLPFVLCTTAIFTYHEAKIEHQDAQLGGVYIVLLELACADHSGCCNIRKRWGCNLRWCVHHCCGIRHRQRSC